jgi:hypothetical protein
MLMDWHENDAAPSMTAATATSLDLAAESRPDRGLVEHVFTRRVAASVRPIADSAASTRSRRRYHTPCPLAVLSNVVSMRIVVVNPFRIGYCLG